MNKRETLKKTGIFLLRKIETLWENFYSVNHCAIEGTSRSTIFDIIERFEPGKNAKHHVRGGDLSPSQNFQSKRQKRT